MKYIFLHREGPQNVAIFLLVIFLYILLLIMHLILKVKNKLPNIITFLICIPHKVILFYLLNMADFWPFYIHFIYFIFKSWYTRFHYHMHSPKSLYIAMKLQRERESIHACVCMFCQGSVPYLYIYIFTNLLR